MTWPGSAVSPPSDLVRARSGRVSTPHETKGWKNALVLTVAALLAETVPCSKTSGPIAGNTIEARNLTVARSAGRRSANCAEEDVENGVGTDDLRRPDGSGDDDRGRIDRDPGVDRQDELGLKGVGGRRRGDGDREVDGIVRRWDCRTDRRRSRRRRSGRS